MENPVWQFKYWNYAPEGFEVPHRRYRQIFERFLKENLESHSMRVSRHNQEEGTMRKHLAEIKAKTMKTIFLEIVTIHILPKEQMQEKTKSASLKVLRVNFVAKQ